MRAARPFFCCRTCGCIKLINFCLSLIVDTILKMADRFNITSLYLDQELGNGRTASKSTCLIHNGTRVLKCNKDDKIFCSVCNEIIAIANDNIVIRNAATYHISCYNTKLRREKLKKKYPNRKFNF